MHGYPQFSFCIPRALAKFCFLRIVSNLSPPQTVSLAAVFWAVTSFRFSEDRKQTARRMRKECSSDVSSRFFLGERCVTAQKTAAMETTPQRGRGLFSLFRAVWGLGKGEGKRAEAGEKEKESAPLERAPDFLFSPFPVFPPFHH